MICLAYLMCICVCTCVCMSVCDMHVCMCAVVMPE